MRGSKSEWMSVFRFSVALLTVVSVVRGFAENGRSFVAD